MIEGEWKYSCPSVCTKQTYLTYTYGGAFCYGGAKDYVSLSGSSDLQMVAAYRPRSMYRQPTFQKQTFCETQKHASSWFWYPEACLIDLCYIVSNLQWCQKSGDDDIKGARGNCDLRVACMSRITWEYDCEACFTDTCYTCRLQRHPKLKCEQVLCHVVRWPPDLLGNWRAAYHISKHLPLYSKTIHRQLQGQLRAYAKGKL